MEHAVRLDKLPEDLTFPEKLADHIRYDPTRRRLVFRGFMCKAEYDRLTQLNSDVEYRRAIDELFVRATDERVDPGKWSRTVWVTVSIGIGILGVCVVIWWWTTRK